MYIVVWRVEGNCICGYYIFIFGYLGVRYYGVFMWRWGGCRWVYWYGVLDFFVRFWFCGLLLRYVIFLSLEYEIEVGLGLI